MKTLHFECDAGISGDMALGAFVDLGMDPDLLREELKKLGLTGWTLEFVRDERQGIGGTRALVLLDGEAAHDHHHKLEHAHHHGDDHDHHHEHHHHDHDHHHHGEHSHNSWKDIRKLIEKSALPPGAKARALGIFSRIAQAESQVHGIPVDDITFHEVGAMDSIIDIVGTAICLDTLKPDRITASEIELGGGTVTCAHGILPVPAPATLILCQGLPVKTGGFNKEMTTPTGAAILAASVDQFITSARFREIKTGYGIGKRKLHRPNVLRLSWREESAPEDGIFPAGESPWLTEDAVYIETNIDDMTGESLGFLMERLFDAGASDVSFVPCIMKKSRPAHLVTILCPKDRVEQIGEALFRYSSTIGFRETPVKKHCLPREEEVKDGPFGVIRRKTVRYGGGQLRSKIEFEDRARVAREKKLSLEDAESLIQKEGGEG